MKVVLDTNILISAALKGGLSEQILRLSASKHLSLITSVEILTELSNKLRTKFGWSKTDIDLYLQTLREISDVVHPSNKITLISRDPDDNKILEAALEGKANLIVSIDKDLINLKKYKNIGIIHPKTLTWILPKLFEEEL